MNLNNIDWNLIIWTIGMLIMAAMITYALNKVTPDNKPGKENKS